jgi:uncharacterized RDD family membrane protein YckC
MSTTPPMQPPGGPPPYQPPLYQPPAYQPSGGIPPYQQPYAPQGAPGYGMPVAAVAYAGFWRRFVALIIDGIILGVVGGVLSAVLGLGSGSAGGGNASFNFGTGGTLLNIVLDLLYFTLMIGLVNGKTLGGMALGIRVVPADGGGSVSIGKALIRTVVAYVSGLVLVLGYLWMLWDRNKQTWHDKAAGTYVVKG